MIWLFLAVTAVCFLILVNRMPGRAAAPTPAPPSGPERRLAARLEGRVRHLAEALGERHDGYPDSYRLAGQYVFDSFEQAGLSPFFQEFTYKGRTYRNVEARLGNPRGPVLVVGAHYDTRPGTPGADDNASAVAALLELPRILARAPIRADLRLVAYANEEEPFFLTPGMGSRVHSAALRREGRPVFGMVCLEMLGYFSSEQGSQKLPWMVRPFFPDRADAIAIVGNTLSWRFTRRFVAAFRRHARIPSIGACLPLLVWSIGRSDQITYWLRGIPAVMLTDTADFRNRNYHTPGDTPDTLDYQSLARVTTGLAGAIGELAARPWPR